MEQLTKKEVNRISSSLRQSSLSLFDSSSKMTSKEVVDKATGSMSRCTSKIKSILDVFLCATTTDSFYRSLFKTMDSNGIPNVSRICSELENDNNVLNKISIKTVYGGTEDMPFRGLLYLLPSIRLCEELKKANKDGDIPNIDFLFMNGAGVLANAIDGNKARETTSQFIKFAQAYIQEYHPEIAKNVNFYIDNTFSSSIINTDEYKIVLNELEQKLGIEANLKIDLEDMGKRRNASENSVKYATLHAFVQDGIVDSKVAKMTNFFENKEDDNSDVIISIGAKPEEKFFRARKLLAEVVSNVSYFTPKPTTQYIANINVPPYSPLPNGELYLKDVLKNPSLILKARKVNRKEGEFGEYQMPVQKAVESIILDTEFSNSDRDIVEFVESYTKNLNDDRDER